MLSKLSKIILFTPLAIFLYDKLKKYRSKYTNKESFFKGKNIIITGASQGIGENLVNKLSNYNCNLFLLARSFKSKNNINLNNSIVCKYKCDCSNYDQVEANIKSIFSQLEKKNNNSTDITDIHNDIYTQNVNAENRNNIDIVIHCAGAGDWKNIQEMEVKETMNCLDAPLLSSMWITRALLSYYKKENKEYLSNIQNIFIQSPVVIQPWKNCSAYAVSRWGQKGFYESLKMDYKMSIVEVILGKVDSSYFSNNPNSKDNFPAISKLLPELSLDESSNIIINSIYYNTNTITPYLLNLLIKLHSFFPNLTRYLVAI